MSDQPRSRRRVLGLAGAAVIGGVAAARYRQAAPPPVETSRSSAPRPTAPPTTQPVTTTTTAPPPVLPRWQPPRGEVEVEAKATAAAVAQALTTHDGDEGAAGLVDRVMAGATGRTDLTSVRRAADVLHLPGQRVVSEVVYPKLGGLAPHHSPTTCSVMVVVEQRGDEVQLQRCLDVRLDRTSTGWELASVQDVSGSPVGRPRPLGPTAEAVLDHPRLELPDSARWDIHEGGVDERVLVELVELGERVDLAVATICRGHPEHVFGTSRASAHMDGRAIDVWYVDGPVVSQQHVGSTAYRVAAEVFHRGRIRNLGAPWAFDPPGGRSFTDPVHADHLHLGV